MATRQFGLERVLVACVAMGLFAPVAGVALEVLGLGAVATLAGTLVLFAVGAFLLAPRVPESLVEILAGRRLALLLWCALGLLASFRMAGLAVFMADSAKPGLSAAWSEKFYIGHSCFSGYVRATELSQQGVTDLYDLQHYKGTVDRFRRDEYLYPPPFLLLMRPFAALSSDFATQRALWFVFEASVTLLGFVALVVWVGKREGALAALLIPAALAAAPTLLTLQTGNFTLALLALVVLAFVAFEERRDALGGALLAFAVAAKLFPGILALYLLLRRRWRAAAWTAAFGALYVAVALLVLGTAPFAHFATYMLPRLASGQVSPWMDSPRFLAFVALNHSVPATVWKLHHLGVSSLGWGALRTVGWVYNLVVVLLAVVVARRAGGMSRPAQAAAWIALFTLAMLRGPFVPDPSALLGPLWILVLLTPEAVQQPRRIAVAAAGWILCSSVLVPSLPLSDGARLVAGLAVQAFILGLAFWVVLRNPGARAVAPEPARSWVVAPAQS